MYYDPEIGNFIRKERLKSSIKNQITLSDMLGCDLSYISMIERGRRLPSPQMALEIERILKIKKGKLLGKVIEVKRQYTLMRLRKRVKIIGRFVSKVKG